jgi:asparagine synthase (glutamine-hydrolysing)
MCGVIAALLRSPTLERERLIGALADLEHRGPDRTAAWVSQDGRMALGHVRLSIIGLDNGDQPLVNEAGDIRTVVNGEFYGYRAIRDALRAEGRRFATDSDSEIALVLYEKLGAGCLRHLRGEFAFVVADQRRRCLFAARDRFGIKPLFYTIWGGDVLIASEIKALLALGAPARWDEEAFFAELHAVRPAERSLFAGIYAVPPGCYLIARDGHVDIHRYWDVDFPTADALAADRRTDREVVDGFRAVFDDAIKERLVADVEVASYLSGGIDSCAVLGLAQRHLARPIRAFTISFDDAVYDEESLARKTAELVGAEFVPVPVTQTELAEALPDAIWHAETLVFNGHGVAKYLLSRAVRDAGIKVVFTGEGADEILAGYPPFRRDVLLSGGGSADQVAERLAELDRANQSSRGLLVADGPAAPGLDVFSRRLGFIPSWIEVQSTMGAKLTPLLNDRFRNLAPTGGQYTEFLDSADPRGRLVGFDPLNQALYLWSATMLPHYILTTLADRMEMAHSVEGRVPFLDHHVAEYAAGLPLRHKIRMEPGRPLREKNVLREAVRDCVIPEVYDRQKHPFMSPPARSDDDPLGVFCQDVLRSSALESQPFFDPKRVRKFIDDIAALPPAGRAAGEGPVLKIVSTCLLGERFGMSA